MNRRRKKQRRKYQVLHLWTYPQANRALPYLRSIATSLREHWLEAQGKKLHAERLSAKSGRLDRQGIWANESAQDDKARAADKFNETLQEMLDMHVFPIDAVQGQALIPFRKDDELAWFVFDLFDEKGWQGWRFHKDTLEERRSMKEVEETKEEDSSASQVV